jgi:hypothetical protein
MKKIITLTIALLMTIFAYSQEKVEKQTTQAEQFSATAGTLIEKQFIDIGKVKGITVQVMKFKDLNNGTSQSALRFEYEYKSSYSSDTKVSVLDLDEIDGLIKSITNLNTTVFSSTRNVYTEVTFISRTGFKAGAYYDVDRAKWVTFVKLEKFDSNSQVFLTTEDFATLLTLVEQAKTKM